MQKKHFIFLLVFGVSFFILINGIAYSAGLFLTCPNGGERWNLGSFKLIKWRVVTIRPYIDILLYKNDKPLGFIARNIPSTKKFFSWEVGKIFSIETRSLVPRAHSKSTIHSKKIFVKPGVDYKIRIRVVHFHSNRSPYSDTSDGPFIIQSSGGKIK